MEPQLLRMWEGKDAAQAVLVKPDVTVTNQSDKDMQLVKLVKLNEFAKRVHAEHGGRVPLSMRSALSDQPSAAPATAGEVASLLAPISEEPQYYAYMAIQPPAVLTGHLRSRATFTARLDELTQSLRAHEEEWRTAGRLPICVSDADERSVLSALRNGRVHSLVWCGTGACGWEAATSPSPVTLEAMLTVIRGLAVAPRVAIVCHSYGARKAAAALHAAGVSTVVWLRVDGDLTERLTPLVFGVIAPVLAAAHGGGTATAIKELALTHGKKLLGSD